jgi:hypothetical protein
MAMIDLRNVTMKIRDGSSTPKELTIKFHEGTLNFTENYNWEYVRDRGELDSTRHGDQEPMSVNFNAQFDYFKGPGFHGDAGISDALNGVGEADDWVGSDDRTGYECEPYCVDLVVLNAPVCVGSVTNPHEDIVLPRFRPTTIEYDVAEGSISVTGECNAVRPESTRKEPPPPP